MPVSQSVPRASSTTESHRTCVFLRYQIHRPSKPRTDLTEARGSILNPQTTNRRLRRQWARSIAIYRSVRPSPFPVYRNARSWNSTGRLTHSDDIRVPDNANADKRHLPTNNPPAPRSRDIIHSIALASTPGDASLPKKQLRPSRIPPRGAASNDADIDRTPAALSEEAKMQQSDGRRSAGFVEEATMRWSCATVTATGTPASSGTLASRSSLLSRGP